MHLKLVLKSRLSLLPKVEILNPHDDYGEVKAR